MKKLIVITLLIFFGQLNHLTASGERSRPSTITQQSESFRPKIKGSRSKSLHGFHRSSKKRKRKKGPKRVNLAKLAYHIALGGVVALIVGFILLNIGLLGTLPFFLFVGSIFIYLLGILASIVGGFMGISASSRLKKEGSDKKGKRFKMARRAIWLGLTSIIAIIYYLAISLKS